MHALVAVAIFAVIAVARAGQDPLPHTTCERTWEKVGCFRDRKNRALPELLVNDRDKNSKYNDGHRLNWKQWNDSLHSLACRCAEKTSELGYKVFGLQFYGECWSGPGGEDTYDRYGVKNKCIMKITGDTTCDKSAEDECVGGKWTNYVYRLSDKKPDLPTDGGYSEWGPWTGCTKTCGGGSRMRERTCTEPEPKNGGKDCSGLGPAEQAESCNDFECPIDGGYSEWGPWGECTKTCGGGSQRRERTCTNPEPKHGGKDCSELGAEEGTQPCNDYECPPPCNRAIDLGNILDISKSIPESKLPLAKGFVLNIAHAFKVSPGGTHMGLIVYNKRAKTLSTLNDSAKQSPQAIKTELEPEERGWGTNTDRALEEAVNMFTPENGDRPDKPNVLIVITDGKNRGGDLAGPLDALKQKHVEIFAIGVGKIDIDQNELKQIAHGKEDHVLQVDDFDELNFQLQRILETSCPNAGD